MTPHERRIERYLEAHPGATKAEARGHGRTPERPGRGRDRPEFETYYRKYNQLKVQAAAEKKRIWGSSDKWRSDRSFKAMAKEDPPMWQMERFLELGEDITSLEDFDWRDWEWLYYH
jgi:hypothetical protein